MDIDNYISSGIIERYVLGSVSSQEKQEVECMSHIYPEILEELNRVQVTFEKLALKGKVEPPKHLKEAILEEIKKTSQDTTLKLEKSASSEARIESSSTDQKQFVLYRNLAAASIIGLIVLGIYASMVTTKVSVEQERLANQKNKVNQLLDINTSLSKDLEMLNSEQENQLYQIAYLCDKNTTKVDLNSLKNEEQVLASVFWNKPTGQVVLSVTDLPSTEENEQYQLWAIADGVPVDMGIINKTLTSELWIEMKEIENAQAFAITIEPLGGSTIPTLENMVVLGNS